MIKDTDEHQREEILEKVRNGKGPGLVSSESTALPKPPLVSILEALQILSFRFCEGFITQV